MKIYLAGGMVSDWRSKLYKAFENETFLDPEIHNFKEELDYTAWDLLAIDKCDLVFAYMEKTNPSGYGLNLEIGYAYAKGKPIIFVDETIVATESDDSRMKYFGMARSCSSYVTPDLDKGIKALEKYIYLWRK